MRILVVGATGLTGMAVCRHLVAGPHQVHAMVRSTSDPARKAELQALGAQPVEGDLKDSLSLADACRGMQAVVSTASSTLSRREGDSIASVDEQGQLQLVETARQSGVDHFVFLSFRDHPRIQYPLTRAKRAVERRLKAGGMAFTILQASYFMEVWLTPALGFDPAGGRVRVYGDGRNAISWVSYQDVARVAAASVDQPAARGQTVEVGGPQPLTPLEVVRMFEASGAGEITVEHVPVAALEAQLQQADDPLAQSFAGLMLQYAAGDAIETGRCSHLFPFRMTSVRDFITAQLTRA